MMEFRLYVRLVAFAGRLLRVSTKIAANPKTNDLKKFLMINSSTFDLNAFFHTMLLCEQGGCQSGRKLISYPYEKRPGRIEHTA